jgi:hypothetical protein
MFVFGPLLLIPHRWRSMMRAMQQGLRSVN